MKKKMNEVVKKAIASYAGVDEKLVENYFYGNDEYLEEITMPKDCMAMQNAVAIFPVLEVGSITTVADLCFAEDWRLFYPIPPEGKTTISDHSGSNVPAEMLAYEYKVADKQPEDPEIGETRIEIVSIRMWKDVEDFREIHVLR